MASQHGAVASETSPLLPKPTGNAAEATPKASAGVISYAIPHESTASIDEDGGEIERQESSEDRAKQYEGLPEIRKTMKYAFPALAIGVFLAAADQTLIVSSYERIGSELHALNKTSWIATAYFLTLTSFQPLYGKLSDIFSRKSCLLVAYTIFGVGCLLCGLARNINELIAARAIAGVGGGGLTTVMSIILSDVIPLKDRGLWQGYINIIYGLGGGAGASLGGILADSIGWRWSFTGQAPICLLAFLSVTFALKLPKREHGNFKEQLGRVDFLGAVILVAAVFALLFGMDRGSNLAWRDKYTITSLCLAFPLFAGFLLVELRIAKEPFAPGRIIFERTLVASYLCNFFSFASQLAAIFYISLFYQAVQGLSASQAGLLIIPSIVCGVSGSLSSGWYMRKTGKYYWITVITYTNQTIGMAIILCFSGVVTKSTVGVVLGSCLCAFSNGIGVTTTLIALISNAARDDQAVATACSYLFRALGSTTGVSLSATVANQVLRRQLVKELGSGAVAEKLQQEVRKSLERIREFEPAVRDAVVRSYTMSTKAAFGLELVLVLGAALSAWLIREKPLSR